MTMFRAPSSATVRLAVRFPRRRFLQQATTLLLGAAFSAAPAMLVFADTDTDLDKRTSAQWVRLKRGLSQKTMAGCRKAAERLVPRMDALLKGPQWESQTLAAIVSELKQAGVLPDRPPPRGPGCPPEADELRGEAANIASIYNSISAALAVAGAAVATIVPVGPVLAAILAAIAAVVILIGQILANAKEQQAAQKEKEEEGKESEQSANRKKLQKRLVDAVEKRDDCDLFGKKAS